MNTLRVFGVFCLCIVFTAKPSDAEIRFKHHFVDNDGPEGEIFFNTVIGDLDIVTRPYKPQHNAVGGKMHVSVLENLTRNPNATPSGSGIGPSSQDFTSPVPTQTTPRLASALAMPNRKPSSAAITQDLDDGSIAHWTFDESAKRCVCGFG